LGMIFCLFSQFVMARVDPDTIDSNIGGLKFLSKQVFASERTSFSLFPECKNINFNFSLSFDCSIYNLSRFGYIFRIIDCNEKVEQSFLHLLYNPTVSPETLNNSSPKLELYSPVSLSKIEFVLPEKQNNLRIAIHYIAALQEVKMRCNGIEKSIQGVNLSREQINIIFGLWGQNPDVAPVELKNIRIRKNGKTINFWPLNEYDGSQAIDKVSGKKSEIKNPVWLRKNHYSWQKLGEFKSDEMVGVIFKPYNQRIFLINKDSLVNFDPISGEYEVLDYFNERPFSPREHFSIYNRSTNQIISYDFHFLRSPKGKRSYSILNEQTLEWDAIDVSSDFVENHHHNIFWNQGSEQVTTFGGYAHFEYFNTFNSFDFSDNSWSNIELSGDTIYPRTHSVVGNDEVNDLFYVFGGFGNEEGRQVLGGRIFFDLFSVDISTKTIKKLLDYPSKEYEFIPRGKLIVDNEGQDFYTLGSKMIDRSNLRLYHIIPSEGIIQSISDSIPVLFTNMSGNAFLFKNDLRQELYCVTRENDREGISKVSIYSLKYPPANFFEGKEEEQINYLAWLAGLLILLSIGVGVLIFLKKKKETPKKKIKPIEYSRQKKNAIWLLGGLKIYDPEGIDITYRLSKKLQELFFLIFFETMNNDGISTMRLSETLWPGMDKYHQKNNRGVSINNLRKVLEDLQGIKLVNENNKWKLECGGDFYCDFLEVKKSLKEKEYIDKPHYLVSMFSFGNVLSSMQFEWLDKYKARYEKEALAVLYSACDNFFSEKKYPACVETAQIIHEKIDPIDEIALAFKIRALNKMKSYKKAHDEFEQFKKRYSKTFNDQYPQTFNEILNHQPDLDLNKL